MSDKKPPQSPLLSEIVRQAEAESILRDPLTRSVMTQFALTLLQNALADVVEALDAIPLPAESKGRIDAAIVNLNEVAKIIETATDHRIEALRRAK